MTGSKNDISLAEKFGRPFKKHTVFMKSKTRSIEDTSFDAVIFIFRYPDENKYKHLLNRLQNCNSFLYGQIVKLKIQWANDSKNRVSIKTTMKST